jgi:hypothetical protein
LIKGSWQQGSVVRRRTRMPRTPAGPPAPREAQEGLRPTAGRVGVVASSSRGLGSAGAARGAGSSGLQISPEPLAGLETDTEGRAGSGRGGHGRCCEGWVRRALEAALT